ncbi:uncharacterized protein BKA78DRAFT_105830 [Phyllosticta capitalensis]|uniref:uncharacterized protein n=1 Tax=Phyllosticta capitalensis TaxID=121624 RepID=UPI00312D6B97
MQSTPTYDVILTTQPSIHPIHASHPIRHELSDPRKKPCAPTHPPPLIVPTSFASSPLPSSPLHTVPSHTIPRHPSQLHCPRQPHHPSAGLGSHQTSGCTIDRRPKRAYHTRLNQTCKRHAEANGSTETKRCLIHRNKNCLSCSFHWEVSSQGKERHPAPCQSAASHAWRACSRS